MDRDLFASLGAALAVGLLIGLERQRAIVRKEGDDTLLGGVRTFPLIALTGAAAALFSSTAPLLLPASTLGLVALMAVHRVSLPVDHREGGLTTEIAAVVTFMLGALTVSTSVIASPGPRLLTVAALAVIVALLLSVKPTLHAAVRKLSDEDMFATLQLLVVAVVLLPLLPDQGYGPYSAINPAQIGKMILLVGTVSFIGYVASRMLGPDKGLTVTGVVGGLVSSTAVTFSMSRRARTDDRYHASCAVAVVAASSMMVLRVLVAVAVIYPPLLPRVALPAAAIAIVGFALLFPLWRKSRAEQKATSDIELKNPFELKSAVVFGLLFAAVIFVSKAARATVGDAALYAAAVVAGASDVDAITLSAATLARGGLDLAVAANTVLLAALANTAVKAGIAWVSGGKAFGKIVGRVLGAMIIAGGVGLVVQTFLG